MPHLHSLKTPYIKMQTSTESWRQSGVEYSKTVASSLLILLQK